MLVTIVVALITAVIGPSILEIVKSKLKKSEELDDPMVFEMEADITINEQLRVLQELIGADRIWVTQFHNGGHFYSSGMSIKKFSIFYERTTDRTASIKDTFQNIPVSLFPKAFSLIYKDGEIIVPNTTENTIDCGLFQVQGKEYKTKSFYVFSIKDINNNFIGSLTISYYEKEHNFTQEEWILIRQKIGAIGAILTDYLHGKR